MKIAGVSVDVSNLPNRELVFNMAINSFEFYMLANKEDLINEILDNSGLWVAQEQNINEIEVIEDALHRVDDKPIKKNKREHN